MKERGGDVFLGETRKSYVATGEKGRWGIPKLAIDKTQEGQQVMHRVQSMDPSGFTFKGDANREADAGKVSPSQIVGRYMFHIPLIGYAYAFFDRNRIVIIIAIALINLAVYLLSEHQRKRRRQGGEDARFPMMQNAPSKAPGMLGGGDAMPNAYRVNPNGISNNGISNTACPANSAFPPFPNDAGHAQNASHIQGASHAQSSGAGPRQRAHHPQTQYTTYVPPRCSAGMRAYHEGLS